MTVTLERAMLKRDAGGIRDPGHLQLNIFTMFDAPLLTLGTSLTASRIGQARSGPPSIVTYALASSNRARALSSCVLSFGRSALTNAGTFLAEGSLASATSFPI